MDANVEYLLKLLHSVLYDEPVPKMGPKVDWDSLITAAGMGEVITLLYKKLNELTGEDRPDEEKLHWLRDYSMTRGMQKLQNYAMLSFVLKKAEERNIQVIVFKGPILGNLYPEPMMRASCDIDVYVEPKDLKAMEDLLLELDFIKNEEHSKEVVPVYLYQNRMMLEVHCCLYEDYTGKRIELLKKMNLTNPDKLVHMNVCGMELATLGYEEQLIFLLFHLIKHISYSGCSLKTIIDIVLYVNAYVDQIDKEDFWKKMKLLNYDNFCRTLFSIGCYYFGMTQNIFIDGSYSENVAKTTMLHLYETGILKASSKGKEEDRRAASIAYQSLQGKEDKKISKFRMWKKTFFPSSKDLSFRYMYARKHPTLVWIAWLHRVLNNVTVRFMSKNNEHVNMMEDMQLANRKLSLLKELDLMKKD